MAANGDDGLVFVEHVVREKALASIHPHAPHRVQVRRVGRQWHRRGGLGHMLRLCPEPAGRV